MLVCDISVYKIADAGARALADALRVNSTLTEINLAGNQICNAGALALADSLCINRGMRVIFVSQNFDITEIGMATFQRAQRENHRLEKVEWEDDGFGFD
jgi:hypothetical protein